jgi:hypothetical protein
MRLIRMKPRETLDEPYLYTGVDNQDFNKDKNNVWLHKLLIGCGIGSEVRFVDAMRRNALWAAWSRYLIIN